MHLTVHTFNGPIHIHGINLSDHDCFVNGVSSTCPLQWLEPPNALAEVGDITIDGVTGSVVAQSNKGSVTVSGTPNAPLQEDTPLGPGVRSSYIIVQSTEGDAALALPTDFAGDALNLSAFQGTVTVTGFPDLNPNSLSRGDAGTGAALINVTADHGNVTLSAL